VAFPIDPIAAFQFVYEGTTRAIDWYQTRGAPFRTDVFIEKHAECVKACINLATDIESLDNDEAREATTTILNMISNVALALRPDDDVNANYMIPVEPTATTIAKAHFADRRLPPESFECLLELRGWAKDVPGFPREFILPVEKATGGHREVIFGAPEAYVANSVRFVRDTLHLRGELKGIERAQVRTEIAAYFKEHKSRIRSFASYPIQDPIGSRVIGVVNIQAMKRALMGVSAGNQRRVTMAISPLLVALGHFVRYHHAREIYPPVQQTEPGNV
jgi:hypothetical protein